MSIFKRKNSTKARLQSLEEALGVFFVPAGVNNEYPEHKTEEDGYGFIPRLNRQVNDLTKKGKK